MQLGPKRLKTPDLHIFFVLQDALLKHVLDSEMVEPVISQLVTVLLRGCQDVNPEVRLLCGECLGELGAIDPGRLDFSPADTQGTGSTFVVRHSFFVATYMYQAES